MRGKCYGIIWNGCWSNFTCGFRTVAAHRRSRMNSVLGKCKLSGLNLRLHSLHMWCLCKKKWIHFQWDTTWCSCSGHRHFWHGCLKLSPAQLFAHRTLCHATAANQVSRWSDINANTTNDTTQCCTMLSPHVQPVPGFDTEPDWVSMFFMHRCCRTKHQTKVFIKISLSNSVKLQTKIYYHETKIYWFLFVWYLKRHFCSSRQNSI